MAPAKAYTVVVCPKKSKVSGLKLTRQKKLEMMRVVRTNLAVTAKELKAVLPSLKGVSMRLIQDVLTASSVLLREGQCESQSLPWR